MLSPIKAARSKIKQIIGIQPRNKLTWYILFAFLLSAATLDGRKYMKNKNHNPKIISIKTPITERIVPHFIYGKRNNSNYYNQNFHNQNVMLNQLNFQSFLSDWDLKW